MRAALLPTPGDPFLLAYWLRNYATWRKHVDELVVCVNGPLSDEEVAFDRSIVEKVGGRFLHFTERIGHDGAIAQLLAETEAEYVVLCEDDAYVRHPDAVDNAFADIESNWTDIVASPRHEDYFGQLQDDWGTYNPGYLAELRHGFWPAFLFARTNDLVAAAPYGDRAWYIGDTIEGWGIVTPEACEYVGVSPDYVHLDTFFGTTFLLRARGLRSQLIHHVRLYDAPAVEAWLAEDPPWFHITGLSTLDYVLNDRDDVTELPLWPRRLGWLSRIMNAEFAVRPFEMWEREFAAMDAFVRKHGISVDDIKAWEERFAPWVNWRDEPFLGVKVTL